MFGYDFMIDDRLNVALIEVNSSPAMDYSTVFILKFNIYHIQYLTAYNRKIS